MSASVATMRRQRVGGKTRGAQIWHAFHVRGSAEGRRGMTRFFAIAWLLAAAVTSAAAQPFPSRPITMVVPFGAGGPTDALARIVAQRMSVALGQTVLVENVTGASGTVGIARVVRATPDGYTIILGNWPA